MLSCKLKLLSSMEKIFPKKIGDAKELNEISVLKNERFSFQIAYTSVDSFKTLLHFRVDSPLENAITVKKVGYVPSELPLFPGIESENILTDQPGLFPDPLYPIEENVIEATDGIYDSLWFTVDLTGKEKPGNYDINIVFEGKEDTCIKTLRVEIIDALMPEQTLKVTQWFHADCIASYYNLTMLSEQHWHYIELFIKTAVRNGINMLLTPIFTPPLDTEIGGERPTIQLVKIALNNGKYSYDFSDLKRWFDLCKNCGIKYFEMAHLFTQWGAAYCPKIMATVDGKYKRIFGWDVNSTSEAYASFLSTFLPELTAFIEKEGLKDVTYFHISDEPTTEHLEQYMVAKSQVSDFLKEYKCIDALSDVKFFKNGTVQIPVPSLGHTEEFIRANVPERWTYYCCGHSPKLSNRFFAYPSWRTRILGIQMFKYKISGFLQWGYNFYYSQCSKKKINPYQVTDAGRAFPSGDAFSVYPGEDCCIESLRLVVFQEGLQDMRALQLLSELIGEKKTVALIERVAGSEICFDSYPMNADYIIALRKEVNTAIKNNMNY